MVRGLFLFYILGLWISGASAECARTYDELEGSPVLLRFREQLLSQRRTLRMTNETQGSHFELSVAPNGDLELTFFTSGLFNLYPIRRSGPVRLCETPEGGMRLIGLGRDEPIRLIDSSTLIVGDGGAKRIFHPGEMPDTLRRVHRSETRQPASDVSN